MERRSGVQDLLASEEEFLNVFEALKDLETYFQEKNAFSYSRIKAAKKITKFGKHLYDPTSYSDTLRGELTKDRNDSLDLLHKNLKGRLVPVIRQGNDEEIEMAHSIITKIAQYILNPKNITILDEMNELMFKLPTYTEKNAPISSLFSRYPTLRSALNVVIIESIFVGSSYIVFHLGVHLLNTSIDYAYFASVSLFGVLTAALIYRYKQIG